MKQKPSILFLCTGNSCRSQMAEGWCRHYWGDDFNIFSAGIQKQCLNPLAVKVMKEVGVDISHHYSKTIEDIHYDGDFNFVFTVCGHAHEHCPLFPGRAKIQHHGFADPPQITKSMTDEEEILQEYRKVCGEIELFIKKIKTLL
jgi:arsenate reductase